MTQDVILAAVINWNGWRDTLFCLRCMQALTGPPFHLLVCDNGSTDESQEQLKAWARQVSGVQGVPMVQPGEGAVVTSYALPDGTGPMLSVHLLRLQRNFGYAGAINRCIAWGGRTLAPDAYWLLNNDIAMDSQALEHLVAAVRIAPDIGLCGSVLLDWEFPHGVQAVGGIYHRWPAVGSHLKTLPAGASAGANAFSEIDYPVGASMLITTRFLQVVGAMDEAYFLYYEEVDWALRGRRLGFRPAVALRSRIRHKEGASTGSVGGVRSKSMLSEYYGVVNRLRFTRKFYPVLLPAVWLSLLLVVADRVRHGEWRRAGLVLRLMLAPGSVRRP